MESNPLEASGEAVINKIMLIRNEKVMLDADLAELYGVTTQLLNEQVNGNLSHFPPDFMFQLTQEEKSEVMVVSDHLSKLKSSSALPFAFTEYGALMLASVLNSEQSAAVNIQAVREFVEMRRLLVTNKELLFQLLELENEMPGNKGSYSQIKQFLDE